MFSIIFEEAMGGTIATPSVMGAPKVTIDMLRAAFPGKYLPKRPYNRRADFNKKSDILKRFKTTNSFISNKDRG